MRSSGWYTGASLMRRIIGMERALALVDGGTIDRRVPAGWFTGPYLARRMALLSQRVAVQDSGAVVTFEHWNNSAQFVDRLLDLDARVSSLSAGGGSAPYVAQAVHFDGISADVYLKSDDLQVIDSRKGLFSFSLYWEDGPSTNQGPQSFAFTSGGYYWVLNVYSAQEGDPSEPFFEVHCQFWDTTNSVHFSFNAQTPWVDDWIQVQISVDTNHPAGEKIGQVVINGMLLTNSSTEDSAAAFNIGWSQDATATEMGSDAGAEQAATFDVSNFYVAMGQFLDLSIPDNVAKFIDGTGKPVSLGTTGASPTGIAPTIFFSGDSSTFPVNHGTGGTFTLTGSLTNASSSPSD